MKRAFNDDAISKAVQKDILRQQEEKRKKADYHKRFVLDKKDREEKEVLSRLNNGDPGLKLYTKDDSHIPFYSENSFERDVVIMSNTTKKKSIEVKRIIQNRNGFKISQTITIGKVGEEEFGVLKTKHRRAAYAVFRVWQEKNWPVELIKDKYCGVFDTTKYELLKWFKKVNSSNPGKHHYNTLMSALQGLESIPIRVVDEWIDHPDNLIDRYKFKILLSADSLERETKSQKYERIRIIISPEITKKFYMRNVKLLLLNVIQDITNEKAQILYPMLDRVISQTGKFDKFLDELSLEYGFPVYKHESKIHEQWDGTVEDLTGKEMSNGRHIAAELKKNKKGRYKFYAIMI